MMAVVILNAFSTLILSITIKSSYTVIDSLEQLLQNKDLSPIIYLSDMDFELIAVHFL